MSDTSTEFYDCAEPSELSELELSEDSDSSSLSDYSEVSADSGASRSSISFTSTNSLATTNSTDLSISSYPVDADDSNSLSSKESHINSHALRSIEQVSKHRGYKDALNLLKKSEDELTSIRRYPGWLLKDVLIQGHILLTDQYLLFFAMLPEYNSEIMRSGALGKRANTILPSKESSKYKRVWVVIRQGSISYYAKPGDVYFPLGVIPFTRVVRCEIGKDPTVIVVETRRKVHQFRADNPTVAREWAKAIRKEVFCEQTRNGEAAIRIPLKNIIRKTVVNAYDLARTATFEVARPNCKSARVSLVFFGSSPDLHNVLEAVTESTMNFSAQSHVKFINDEVDESSLKPVDEDILDTTPSLMTQSFGNVIDPKITRKDSKDDTQSSIIPFISTVSMPKLGVLSKLNSKFSSHERHIHNTAVDAAKAASSAVTAAASSLKNSNRNSVYSENEPEALNHTSQHALGVEKDESMEADTDTDADAELSDDSDGESYTSQSNDQRSCEHYGVHGASVIRSFHADLKKPEASMFWSGTAVLTTLYLCFQRENIKGGSWRMVVPLKDIVHLSRDTTNGSVMNIEVCESYYGVIKLGFNDNRTRSEAQRILEENVKARKKQLNVAMHKRHIFDAKAEDKFLEYCVLSARVSVGMTPDGIPSRDVVPPLIFDPHSSEAKEILMRKPFKSLKFAMLMIGSRGDVQPYIGLCQGLMAEGHSCVIITHGEFQSWVEGFGIEFREVGGDPRKLMEIIIKYGSISYGFMKEALHNFKSWIKELMHDSWTVIRELNADVLIESPSSMIGIHIAEALNIAYFRAFTMPWTRTKTYPQALIMPDQKKDSNYNYLTYVMYDHLVWFAISKYVNHWRKHHLNLPPTDLDLMNQDDIPFLYCVSPSVLVPPLDQPDWVHNCGYWEMKEDKKDDVDPKLVEFIEKARKLKKPLAYVGFGSIIVTNPAEMTRSVVDAVKEAGLYCVLARGWSARSTKQDQLKQEDSGSSSESDSDDEDQKKKRNLLGLKKVKHLRRSKSVSGAETKKEEVTADGKDKTPLPEFIFEVESVSHAWLFPQVDVCVHHGGSGTTGASLKAGKPTIIKPFFGDQFFYGNRVEYLNAGVNLKRLTKSGLRDALVKCVSDRQLIRQASTIGDKIRHEHGVEEGIIAIYDELEYARDVTESRRKSTLQASQDKKYLPERIPFRNTIDRAVNPARKFSHLWPSLPKIGRREEQSRDRDASGKEVDVSA